MSQRALDEFDRALLQMFAEGQARLPEQDRCAHHKSEMCLDECDGFKCTKVRGHAGNHMAHNSLGNVATEWEDK